jgi:hypothetical protein
VRCSVTQAVPQLMRKMLACRGLRLIATPLHSINVPARAWLQTGDREEVGIDAI